MRKCNEYRKDEGKEKDKPYDTNQTECGKAVVIRRKDKDGGGDIILVRNKSSAINGDGN